MMRTLPFLGTVLLSTLVSPVWSDAKLEEDPFLQPYVAQLKKQTASATLESVKTLAESDLIVLHHGYGTWIRNKWLWGDRDPALVQFFRTHGIRHPDSMSMVLIRALWTDLNRNLTREEQARIDARRALVAAKRASYNTLSEECATRLAGSKVDFDRCYAAHGLPSKNPLGREPFYELVVGNTGIVKRIVFFDGASQKLKGCLRRQIETYTFSPFEHDEELTLYIVEFPNCGVSEGNRLY